MKPLLSYYGGKQRMVKNLLPLIPKHKVYVEPFCGGASLFFAKDVPKVTNTHHYREVLNDIDGELVNFYMVAKKHPELLLKRLGEYPYSEAIHKHFKTYKNHKNPATRAVGYYIRIMWSFSKKLDGGFAFSKYNENNCSTNLSKLNSLNVQLDRIHNAYLFSRDAIDVIERFDCPEAFFYCDPPYPDTHQGHYKGYSQEDFDRLIETLANCQGSFMLSCYENAAVPKDWERHEFETVNSSAKNKRTARKEIVWRKLSPWALEEERPEDPSMLDLIEN